MSDVNRPPSHVQINRDVWNADAPRWVERGERSWRSTPFWGAWQLPDDELPLLPESLDGLDCIELGCGTGYGSAWMRRRGAASVVGLDVSEEQLQTAVRLAAEHRLDIHFLHASAEAVPLPDASVDFALSEYGAAIWCDPQVWLREAHRLLRPGGRLVFLGTHPLAHVAAPLDGAIPVETVMHRPWFDMRVLDWTDAVDEPGGIEFCLPTGEWFTLFREIGFEVQHYAEPRSTREGDEHEFAITPSWARRWPSEQVWWLRRRD